MLLPYHVLVTVFKVKLQWELFTLVWEVFLFSFFFWGGDCIEIQVNWFPHCKMNN